jgi:membrane-associated phospholipid phosphatase
MSAASLPLSIRTHNAADRALYGAASCTVAYLGLASLPMARYAYASGHWLPLVTHMLALAFGVSVLFSTSPALRPLRDWLPLALGPFLYVELRWLIEGFGRSHADAMIQGWESALFPGQPAETWATRLPVRWLSEALHLAYASYYLLVYLPPAILYVRGRRDCFARTILALAMVYGVCFVTYVLLPVDGPRFLHGPASAPEGPVRSFVLALLQTGSSRGTAFPSSHIAASVVASLSALACQPRVGAVVSVLTLGLAVATVYGGFHYLVDAIAGVAVGLVVWLLASALWRALSTPGAQSASAA